MFFWYLTLVKFIGNHLDGFPLLWATCPYAWLPLTQADCWVRTKSRQTHTISSSQPLTTPLFPTNAWMNQIVLVGFLPCDNWRNCELHLFGCGNSLVLNRDNRGVGMLLHMQMTAPHKLACYTMFVLLHGRWWLGIMHVGWMVQLSLLVLSSCQTTRIAACGVSITMTMATLMKGLSR